MPPPSPPLEIVELDYESDSDSDMDIVIEEITTAKKNEQACNDEENKENI